MIFTLLFLAALWLVNALLGIFPTVFPFPDALRDALETTVQLVWSLDPFIPVALYLQIIGIIVIIELLEYGYLAFRWIIRKIPFANVK